MCARRAENQWTAAQRPSVLFVAIGAGYLTGPRLLAVGDDVFLVLKADRQAGVLLVHGAWAESHAPDSTADELSQELRLMAGWLGLETIGPPAKGDLAGELSTALARHLD